MKKIIIYALLILTTYNVFAQPMLIGKVIGVKEGDTVEVLDNQNKTTFLRLAEVDCPEKNNPTATLQNNLHPKRYIAKQSLTC